MPSPLPTPSATLTAGFIGLSLAAAALAPVAVRTASARAGLPSATVRRHTAIAIAVTVVWLALTGGLAAAGVLHFEPPPTMLPVFIATFVIAFAVSFSALGRRLAALPVAALVGYQAFRVGVELLMHRAYTEGLMPVQMSYSGRNFDIVTGLTALAVAPLLAAKGAQWSRTLLFAWNTLGLGLLVNILVVAILSAPLPIRVFMNEPANTWIGTFPFIWLPTILVLAAVTGHLLVYRRLAAERSA